MRLAVQVGGSRPVGSAVLKTDLVEREGVQIYRLTDRLNVDLPGLGSARLRVEADVRADFTALRVVLSTEEPRANAAPSRQRIVLEQLGGRWVRSVTHGDGAPVITHLDDLPERILVLTPPLGAGERLARVIEGEVGLRIKIPANDLETGEPTVYKLSVDDAGEATLAGKTVETVQIVRREGPARLLVWRHALSGEPLRISRDGGGGRLLLRHPDLEVAAPDAAGPTGRVLAFLQSAARGEKDALREALDFDALYAGAGGLPADATRRRLFEQVLLERLGDPDWLEERGLLFVAGACDAKSLVEELDKHQATVRPKGAPKRTAFRLAKSGGKWRIVGLPSG
jgi:hypothetical protein